MFVVTSYSFAAAPHLGTRIGGWISGLHRHLATSNPDINDEGPKLLEHLEEQEVPHPAVHRLPERSPLSR